MIVTSSDNCSLAAFDIAFFNNSPFAPSFSFQLLVSRFQITFFDLSDFFVCDGCSIMLFVIVVFLVKLGMFLHLVSDAKSNASAFTVSAWTPGNPLDKVIGAWSVAWLGFVVFGIIDQIESISFGDFTTDVGYVAVGVNCINTEYFDAISADTNPGSFSDSHSACSILVVMIGSTFVSEFVDHICTKSTLHDSDYQNGSLLVDSNYATYLLIGNLVRHIDPHFENRKDPEAATRLDHRNESFPGRRLPA